MSLRMRDTKRQESPDPLNGSNDHPMQFNRRTSTAYHIPTSTPPGHHSWELSGYLSLDPQTPILRFYPDSLLNAVCIGQSMIRYDMRHDYPSGRRTCHLIERTDFVLISAFSHRCDLFDLVVLCAHLYLSGLLLRAADRARGCSSAFTQAESCVIKCSILSQQARKDGHPVSTTIRRFVAVDNQCQTSSPFVLATCISARCYGSANLVELSICEKHLDVICDALPLLYRF
ncbi:hypothetical protein Tco_1183033 [Tanacetum coccineum]